MFSDFALLGFGIGFGLIILIVVIAVFIFEICMIVSAITNKFISDTARVLWVIGMLLIHPFVAIAYYFTDYRKHS